MQPSDKKELNILLRLIDRVGAWVTMWICASKDQRDKQYGESKFAETHLQVITEDVNDE